MDLTPAAVTMITHRPSNGAAQILIVRRNPELPVQGGVWAFPGGRLAPADGRDSAQLETARNCAVRETAEETGLRLKAADLQAVARWITPVQIRPRFDTRFFSVTGAEHHVRVDGREIVDHRWLTAADALSRHNQGELRLAPPVFVMLALLAEAQAAGTPWPLESPIIFRPRLFRRGSVEGALYEGDAAYPDGEIERPGPRHRLWMETAAWRYERRLERNAGAEGR